VVFDQPLGPVFVHVLLNKRAVSAIQ
jgi:hypothetical protein